MKRIPIQIRIPIIFDKQYDCPFENPFGYIYLVTNKVNQHMYVGKHEFHKPYLDEAYKGSGKRLISAYSSSKYSEEDFETIILQWIGTNNRDLNKAEVFWIDVMGTYKFPQHYNESAGGDGFQGGKKHPYFSTPRDEETRNKISLSVKNYVAKHLNRNINTKGLIHGGNRKGYTPSLETIEKIRRNMPNHSGINNPMYGRVGGTHPRAKAVIQLSLNNEFIRRYECIKQVSEFGFDRNIVSDCCRKLRKSYKNYIWTYE